jgi:hypothetical protein
MVENPYVMAGNDFGAEFFNLGKSAVILIEAH